MHQEINKFRHRQGLCVRITASKKPNAHALYAYFTEVRGKVYQFALMKENFHCGALL